MCLNKLNRALGKQVVFSKRIEKIRTRKYLDEDKTQFIYTKYNWITRDCNLTTGIICGKRRKLSGNWDFFEGGDYGISRMAFNVTNKIDCYLIAISLNQTVLVPCDLVEFCS